MEADRLRFVRLRFLATVRARTALGGSLALGIALLLSASTAGGLLRRSLIRSIDEVAEVRAAEVAVLPVNDPLPAGLASGGGEIVQLVSIVGAKVVDIAADSLVIQMADDEDTIDAFVALMRPFGIKEMVRTGRVAMVRGAAGVTRAPSFEELAHPTSRPRYEARKKVTADLTGDAG